jgi:hypothetical protein
VPDLWRQLEQLVECWRVVREFEQRPVEFEQQRVVPCGLGFTSHRASGWWSQGRRFPARGQIIGHGEIGVSSPFW